MRLAKLMAAAASVSLVATPVMAAEANSAAKLSVAKSVRAGAPAGEGNKALGGSGIIVGVLAAAAVIAGIIIVADDDDDSDSN